MQRANYKAVQLFKKGASQEVLVKAYSNFYENELALIKKPADKNQQAINSKKTIFNIFYAANLFLATS